MKRTVPIFIAVLAIGAVITGAAYEKCAPTPGSTSDSRPSAPRATVDPFTAPPPAARGQSSLRGHVIGPDGTPAAGASVIAVEAAGDVLSARACHCGTELLPGKTLLNCPCQDEALITAVANRQGEPQLLARAESTADGSFELTGLPDGPVALWAQHPLGVAVVEKATLSDWAELVLAPAIELSGTVTDGKRKPLAGALVTVIAEPSSRYFEAVTDANGAFKRAGLPHTPLRVVTSLQGFIPDLSQLDPDDDPVLKVILSTPINVAGKVVRGGEPVEGATVSATDPDHEGPVTTTSGADGTFQFEALRMPVLRVTAKKGYQLAAVGVYDEEQDPLHLVLELKPAGIVAGLVADSSGNPIAGADVMVSVTEQGGGDATTGKDGRFELLVPAGRGEARAMLLGYLERDPVEVDVEAGKTKQVALTLDRGAVISGVVLDPAGRPVSGAFVAEDEQVIRQKHGARARYSMTTVADGRFSLGGLDPGKTALLVKHDAWQLKRLTVDAPQESVEVRLEAGATVEGHVREADGSPVVGARVAAVPDDKIDMHGNGGPSLVEVKETRTKGDGSYELEGVEPRSYLFTGRDQPTSRTTMSRVTVSGGSNTVELTFEAALPLGGTAVDQDGKPIPGVRIDAVWPTRVEREVLAKRNRDVADILAGPSSRGGETDAAGKFLFKSVPPGKVRLIVYAEGYRPEPAKDVEAGDTGVKLVLRREPRVSGQVVGADRAPMVRFYADGEDVRDPAGHFDVPRAGREQLIIVAEGFAPAVVDLPKDEGDRDVGTVVLSRGRSVELHVSDARSGAPLEGVQAIPSSAGAYLAGGGMDETLESEVSDAKGVLPLTRVPDGEVTVELRREGYLQASITVPPGATTAQAKLDPGERIEGRVVDDKGNPLAAAAVHAASEEDESGGNDSSTADGHFAITALTAGLYTLSVEDHGRKLTFVPKQVKVEAAKAAVVELKAMGSSASLDVRLFDAGGDELLGQVRLVPGALDGPLTLDAYHRLRILELNPPARNGHFAALEPGTYTVLIIAGGAQVFVYSQLIEVAKGENTVKVVLSPSMPHLNLSE